MKILLLVIVVWGLMAVPVSADSAVSMPEHLAGADWHWDDPPATRDYILARLTVHEMPTEVPSPASGIYLMVANSFVGEHGFYFGLQTNMQHPDGHHVGPGMIFSRWGTRDLANARWDSEDGFAQSSGHEGDFIGVRLHYAWGPGEYLFIMNGDSGNGWWTLYGFDLSAGRRFEVGQLWFPDGQLSTKVYSTVEIYGSGPINANDIPAIHVEMQQPNMGYERPSRIMNFNSDAVPSSSSRYEQGKLHLRAGL